MPPFPVPVFLGPPRLALHDHKYTPFHLVASLPLPRLFPFLCAHPRRSSLGSSTLWTHSKPASCPVPSPCAILSLPIASHLSSARSLSPSTSPLLSLRVELGRLTDSRRPFYLQILVCPPHSLPLLLHSHIIVPRRLADSDISDARYVQFTAFGAQSPAKWPQTK